MNKRSLRTVVGRVVATVITLTSNLLVAGLLVLTVSGCTGNTAAPQRIVEEGKTGRLPEAHRFGDAATLSMVTVDPVQTDSIMSLPKELIQAGRFIEPRRGDDEWWLALGIYFEARNEPEAGQLKVAAAILNRVHDPRWPNTIERVLRQGEEKRNRCQFSFMCDGKPERIANHAAWKVAVKVARAALHARASGVSLGCAHSYHADYVTNKSALRWFASLREETQINTHLFFCD